MMFSVWKPLLVFIPYLVWCYRISNGQGIACSSCQCSYLPGGILDCSGRNITSFTECDRLYSCARVLATLNFSGNAITEVGGLYINELSSGGSDECYLDFSSNVISIFSHTFFDLNCQSFTLDLSFNAFRNISPNSFSFEVFELNLTTLTFRFTGNKIRFLQPLSLFDSPFTYRIGEMTIDLSFNEIVTTNDLQFILFNTFFQSAHVERIYLLLNNNNITNFGLSAFMGSRFPTPSSIYVDLSYNDISHFTKEDIKRSVILDVNIRFNFSGNILNCDCSQRFISNISSPIRGVLSTQALVDTTCAEPSSVSGRPIISLSAEEFTCSPKLDPKAVLVYEVAEGETVEIRCPFIEAEPPVEYIDWEFRPDAIQGDTSSSQFQSTCVDCPLIIRDVQSDDEGEYRCTVSNGDTLTISQTLQLLSGDRDVTTISSVTGPRPITTISSVTGPRLVTTISSVTGPRPVTTELINPTASAPPVQEGQTGLLAVVIVLSVLLALTTTSLIAVGYTLYRLKNGAVKSGKEVAVKYRPEPPSAAQPTGQTPRQENRSYGDDDGSYEVPCKAVTQKMTGGDEDIYEVRERTVTG